MVEYVRLLLAAAEAIVRASAGRAVRQGGGATPGQACSERRASKGTHQNILSGVLLSEARSNRPHTDNCPQYPSTMCTELSWFIAHLALSIHRIILPK